MVSVSASVGGLSISLATFMAGSAAIRKPMVVKTVPRATTVRALRMSDFFGGAAGYAIAAPC